MPQQQIGGSGADNLIKVCQDLRDLGTLLDQRVSGILTVLSSLQTRVAEIDSAVDSIVASLSSGIGTKDLLVDGEAVGNIALPANTETWVTPWINVTRYLYIAWFAHPISGLVTGTKCCFAPYPDGTGHTWNNNAISTTVGFMSQNGPSAAGLWTPGHTAPSAFRGARWALTSASGAVYRFSVCGYRS